MSEKQYKSFLAEAPSRSTLGELKTLPQTSWSAGEGITPSHSDPYPLDIPSPFRPNPIDVLGISLLSAFGISIAAPVARQLIFICAANRNILDSKCYIQALYISTVMDRN